MNLNSYNNYYGLFAGLTAALVALEPITDYFLKLVTRTHSDFSVNVENAKRSCEQDLQFALSALTVDEYSEEREFNDAIDAGDIATNVYAKIYDERQIILAKCDELLFNFDISTEKHYIGQQTRKISIYLFVYCLTLIISCGLEQDKVIKTPLDFVGTFTLFSIFALIGISMGVCRPNSLRYRYCIVLPFLIVAFSCTHYYFRLAGFSSPDILIISSTLLFCIYGVFLMYLRVLYWFYITYPFKLVQIKFYEAEQKRKFDLPPMFKTIGHENRFYYLIQKNRLYLFIKRFLKRKKK